jgi:hypothetical protein
MKPPREDEAAEQGDVATPHPAPQIVCLEGRVDPLELVIHALNESGATGVGRLLAVHEFDGDPRR